MFKILFAFAGGSLVFTLLLGLPSIAGFAAVPWGQGFLSFEMIGPITSSCIYLLVAVV